MLRFESCWYFDSNFFLKMIMWLVNNNIGYLNKRYTHVIQTLYNVINVIQTVNVLQMLYKRYAQLAVLLVLCFSLY
jgi:hypothetical protein